LREERERAAAMIAELFDFFVELWAALFRGLQNVPVTEWVDLGEGDYLR
jgi:hypothetical protein